MGPEGAANIIFKKDIVGAENPAEMRKLKIQEYKEKFANPYVAAAKGYIDSVIAPGPKPAWFIEHALNVSAHKNRSRPTKSTAISVLNPGKIMEKNHYDTLETMHGTFQTTLTKKHLARSRGSRRTRSTSNPPSRERS